MKRLPEGFWPAVLALGILAVPVLGLLYGLLVRPFLGVR